MQDLLKYTNNSQSCATARLDGAFKSLLKGWKPSKGFLKNSNTGIVLNVIWR